MLTLNDNDIAFSKYAQFIKEKNTVIIINGYSGVWGAVDRDMFDKINYCIVNRFSPLQYINSLDSQCDKQQLSEIFQVLIEEKMLKNSSEEELKIDIKNIKDVEFKLTNRCNLKCLHCAASADINNEDLLGTEEIIKILNKISKMNVDTLLLTGGEPLIRKDIEQILLHINKNFKGKVNLITNGTLINKEMAAILKKCIGAISISIDGYDEKSTEYVRGKGVYKKIVQAVHYLKEVGFTKDTIDLSMTCTYQNIEHKDNFYNLCKKLDVTGSVRKLSPLGRGLKNYKDIGTRDYLALNGINSEDIETIRESLECKIFCRAGIEKFMINEFGDMYPCLILESEEYKFGNIIKEDPNYIFASKKYYEFIKNKLQRSIVDDVDKCKDCNVRYFCMDRCLGQNIGYYSNKEICEYRCNQVYPYLNKVLWD
ncbi:radical SAM protein [Clostridium sp. P21]|uniref:Radical SAM protein n=1 Tax=Clostridium muellerianum TaxID=2716538 RepID=A0A7Y0HP23_9CLOT|nr:radical SAM protein [Clostridium muellerianum]NMM63780.1 radical SAM protein [Clostridium muellerianum]